MRIYAHRGAPSSPRSENTLPAVRAALLDGADGVEVDLRLSADDVLVVSHDATLRRVAASELAVATTCWKELRTAAACSGVPLARVEEVLAELRGRPAVLEVKRPQPGGVPRTVAALLALLERLHEDGMPLDVTVSSFHPDVVAEVRRSAPRLPALRSALLGDVRDRTTSLLRCALEDGHDQVHPNVAALLAEPSAVARAHALGVAVVPWTVNRRRVLRRLAALGVDGCITDLPRSARLAVEGHSRAVA